MDVRKTEMVRIDLSVEEAMNLREYLAGTEHENDEIDIFGVELDEKLEDADVPDSVA